MTSGARPETDAEDTFAFIIHPIDPKRDVSRKYPALGKLPLWLIDYLSLFFPPIFISEITSIRSAHTGHTVKGWFVACPLTPTRMVNLPPSVAYKKIIQTGRLAERLGARIVGLGAFTSVVGDAGLTISQGLNVPVTTGNSYTVAIAVQAIREAAALMGIPIQQASAAVVGATGTIGSVCAELLAVEAAELLLIGQRLDRLNRVAARARERGCERVHVSQDLTGLSEAHLVITVTSAVEALIEPRHLRRGAIVCDVARPRDVSHLVTQQRPDVLVIEGGMVEVPGSVDFGFDFGFPPTMAYACMAETMVLALERRYECFTLGRRVELSQVLTIDKMATKHGFKLGGFRSFERAITKDEIASIRESARTSRTTDLVQTEAQAPAMAELALPQSMKE